MDAASQHGGRARPPVFESRVGRFGAAIVMAFSALVGCSYWWERDWEFSVLTVGAEIMALVGLTLTIWQFSNGAWRRGLAGIVVTALAAAWCGMTMFQKIDADTREEAIRAAQERPAYIFASNAATTAEGLLTARLRAPNPRPTCACPQTIQAWEASEGAAIERLRNERDAAVRQMEAAIPSHEADWIAVARGFAIEAAKLLGFVAFGIVVVAPVARAAPARQEPWRPQVVAGTEAPPAQRPTHPPTSPLTLRRVIGWRPLLAGILGWGVASTQQIPEPTAPPAQPVEPLVEMVDVVDLRHAAAQLSARRLGERRIAAQLTRETGREITRWQVRKLLGRVAA